MAVATSAWSQNATTLTTYELHANIETVSVVASYTGDDNVNAVAHVSYRPAGSGAFVAGHDLVRLAGKRFAGSVFFLKSATSYEVRVVVDDADNASQPTFIAAVLTRADTPPPSAGAAWYVDATSGSDANPGTAVLPFKTIQRGANAAGAGDSVRVLPGVYREQVVPPTSGLLAAPIRFAAEGPGVVLDGSDAAIAAGATWTNAGVALWWTPFSGQSIYVAVDDARVYDYQALANLQAEDGNIATPGAITGGFFVDAAAQRLYLITPDHTSPALHAVHVAVLPSAFLLDTIWSVVIDGFEMRYYGRDASYGGIGVDIRDSSYVWVRNNFIHHVNDGVRVRRAQSSENVIEFNRIRDTSVYGWPWASVKAHTPEASSVSILAGSGNVVRCNDMEGTFNGIYTGAFGDANEDIARDTDVYKNELRFHGDDGLELEGAQRNVRAWSNIVRDVYNAVSIAPIEVGPVFLVRNLLWGYQQHAVKANNGTYGWVFVYHTTAVPQAGVVYPDAQAWEPPLPFGAVTTRNNIWEANRYVIEFIPTSFTSPVDWDVDDLYSNDTEGLGRYVKWLNIKYPDIVSLSASGTIEAKGFGVKPQYLDAANGDFRLAVGSPLADSGTFIAGINDGYAGAGPDLGAFERDGVVPGCVAASAGPRLLRNAEWPAQALEGIFTGPQAGCGAPLDPGCPAPGPPQVSLDPFGADCLPGSAAPSDDDTYLQGFACGGVDPDASVLIDPSRPLVFYQVDKAPSACDSLRLTKVSMGPSGLVRIDCQ